MKISEYRSGECCFGLYTDLKGLVRFLTMVILAMADYNMNESSAFGRPETSKVVKVAGAASGRVGPNPTQVHGCPGIKLIAFDSQRHSDSNGAARGIILTVLRASTATASSLRASYRALPPLWDV